MFSSPKDERIIILSVCGLKQGGIELPELTMPTHLKASEEEMDPDSTLVFGENEENTSEV